MSLKDVYQRFLADHRQSTSSLAADASLFYIPTTTKVEGRDAVLNHLTKQQNIVKKKAQDVLGVVEGSDALCLDVETTLQFETGGGAYLPQLDDNFLTDRVATFPTIHIVRFNNQNQIQTVRIHWEQASLLKQVEVIGSRSRGWPIREATDQTRLIKSAIAATPAHVGSAPRPSSNQEESSRPVTPGKRHIKDPYAAESLTELLSPSKDDRTEPVRAPRSAAIAKPPPRNYEELFVGGDDDEPDVTPSKPARGPIAPKAGAGRNFQGNRIFGDDDEESHPQIAYKANPKRFDHFEIGGDNVDREVQEKPPAGRPKSRHTPQWELNDTFVPEKPRRGLRGQEVSHLPWDDIVPQPTPPPRHHVVHPRRDAETHFELKDPEEQPKSGRIISSFNNKGLHLYRDPVFDSPEKENQAPNMFTSKPTSRKNDFESHWHMTDSPQGHKANAENHQPVGQNRTQSAKMMESSWDRYDESPQRPSVAAPRNGVRNAYHKSWDFGDE